MLYLPPHAAHDGVAEGDCMTISIGFRAPTLATLACGMLEAANDQIMAKLGDTGGLYANPVIRGPVLSATYKDAGTPATDHPAELPQSLVEASVKAMEKIKFNEALAERFLGQWLTEPPSSAYFEPGDERLDLGEGMPAGGRLVLDRCTRLMYRGRQLFINGEVAATPATAALRHLADTRELPCSHALARKLSGAERDMLTEWLHEGWLHHGAG